ncbi:MAG: lipopolysaccharide biosynthesis protein [Fusobacteriaceae bacterium]|jgi:heptose II phosphotransferase|nr:lipopolysaccharide biosynthesis protein [Fusobacteriaceae bacterium]
MEKIKINSKHVYYSEKDNLKYFDAIENKNYELLKILKDDNRSYVALIEIYNMKIIYKIPREKNKRKWQRFLSVFRGSESKREYKNIEKIKRWGFNCTKPIIATEEKCGFFVIDSYFLYFYIEGKQSRSNNAEEVAKVLSEIHQLGFLHGDSQLENFIISTENKIYLIDTKFIKNFYGNFGKAYEFIYLEESCHDDKISLYNKNSFFYIVAHILKKYLELIRKMKKNRREN